MYTFRVTQHRHKEDTSTSEHRALKSENNKLKKELKRLRKEISKLIAIENDLVDNEAVKPLVLKEKCPDCGSEDLKEVNLGVKILIVCISCRWRKPK